MSKICCDIKTQLAQFDRLVKSLQYNLQTRPAQFKDQKAKDILNN